MAKNTQVALFGNSLVLSAIGASLSARPELDVLEIDASEANALKQLNALAPDAVIFDVHSVPTDFDLTFLEAHPGIKLIAFNLTSAKITLLSSRASQVFTTDDLVQAIRNQVSESAVSSQA